MKKKKAKTSADKQKKKKGRKIRYLQPDGGGITCAWQVLHDGVERREGGGS